MPRCSLIPTERRTRGRLNKSLIFFFFFFPLAAASTLLAASSPSTLSLRASGAARRSPVADWRQEGVSTSVTWKRGGKKRKKPTTTLCPEQYDSLGSAGCSNTEFTLTSNATLQTRPGYFWVNNSMEHDLLDSSQLSAYRMVLRQS